MKKYTLGFAEAGRCSAGVAHGVGDFSELGEGAWQTDDCHYYSTSDQPVWLPDDAIPLGIEVDENYDRFVYFLIPDKG